MVEIRSMWDWKEALIRYPTETIRVEIRSMWDWKLSFTSLTSSVTLLKSDQCEIESFLHLLLFLLSLYVEIRSMWDWKESISEVIKTVNFVEIRSMWDWKRFVQCWVWTNIEGWNQINVRLKEFMNTEEKEIYRVEIRSMWDWKVDMC